MPRNRPGSRHQRTRKFSRPAASRPPPRRGAASITTAGITASTSTGITAGIITAGITAGITVGITAGIIAGIIARSVTYIT
jgi:hypothetical protein